MPRIITLTPNPALDFSFEADKVEPNQKLRCSNPRVDAGGGGVNVARAALRLSAQTLAIFTTGGLHGATLKEAVARENVPARIIPVGGETRPAFHVRETSSGDEFRFNFPGAEMSDGEASLFLTALEEEAKSGDYIVASGSLPPGAPRDFWGRAAHIAKSKGARFAIDSTKGVVEALEEGVDLLRLNKSEAPTFAGRSLQWPDDAANFAMDLVAKGKAGRVAITHGGEGGILAGPSGVARAPSPDVKIVSAVGAGDSFVAALVIALMKNEPDANALRFALAAASATLMTPGTALFEPKEVVRIYEASLRA